MFMRSLHVLTAVLLVFVSVRTEAQAGFTLQEAMDYAAKNSYMIQKSEMDVDKADGKVKETTGMGLPQISGMGEFQNFLDIPTVLVPDFGGNPENLIPAQFGTNYNITGGVEANQLLFDGSYIVALQAARTYRELSENVYFKTKQEVKAAVANAYAAVIVAAENRKTLEGNYEALQTTYDETRALYEEGFAEEQDADQLNILLRNNKNQLAQAERLESIASKLLKFQMGIPVDSNITLQDSIDKIVGFGIDPSSAAEPFNENANIDFRIALTNQTAKELELKNQRALALPRLNAFFSYRQQFFSNELNVGANNVWFPATVWGLNLNVPLFTGLQRHYAIKQSQIELEQAHLERIEKSEELKMEFERYKSDFSFALEQFKNNKDNLDLAEKILNNETIKFKEGVSSGLDLAQVQQQFFQTQSEYVQSINSLVEAKTNLDKILNKY